MTAKTGQATRISTSSGPRLTFPNLVSNFGFRFPFLHECFPVSKSVFTYFSAQRLALLLQLLCLSACGQTTVNDNQGASHLFVGDELLCDNLNGIPVYCDNAGTYTFVFNKQTFSLPFPSGSPSESTTFNTLPNVGSISSSLDFKTANPPIWVGSGRQAGNLVNGPYWDSDAPGLMSAKFIVSAVVYKHEYTTLYKCLSGCPHPLVQAGPIFEEPIAGKSNFTVINGAGSRPTAILNSDTPMFTIEITVGGGTEVKASKTFYWSDFICKAPIPFTSSHETAVFGDAAFPLGPVRLTESKRTPCTLNAGLPYAWEGLGDTMRSIELTTSIAAGTRGLEYRITNQYPFYDFYVLFGKVVVAGYKGPFQ